jgi:hypothetical protein
LIHKFPELAGRTIASAEVRLGNPDTTEPDEVELRFTDDTIQIFEVRPRLPEFSHYLRVADQEPLPDPVPLPRANGNVDKK